MKVAVCYNIAAPDPSRGNRCDRIAEEGAAIESAAVSSALVTLGHRTVTIPLGNDPGDFFRRLQAFRPETIFNLCEGIWGDSHLELHAAALLELSGCPVTGSSPLCLGLTQDKVRTKQLLQAHGLPTPPFVTVPYGKKMSQNPRLHYPLIVKPRSEDASQGITTASVVEDLASLQEQASYIHRNYQQDALVEEFITGRELNVALLGNGDTVTILPCSEIRFDPALPRPIVSFAGKWIEESSAYRGTLPVCPAVLAEIDAVAVRSVALAAFHAMGCRDYARIDIRLRKGIPYILEVNANPDLSPAAGLARSAAADGLDYPALVSCILTLARNRSEDLHAA